MTIYVETLNDFQDFQTGIANGTCFFHFIYDESVHPIKVQPCVLFVYHFETDKTFVFSFNHPDVVCINYNILKNLVNVNATKLIYDKKNVSHFCNMNNFIDIKFDKYTKTLNEISCKLPTYKDIKSCPIMILKKSFDDTLKLFKNEISTIDADAYTFENEFSRQLSNIEKNGIHVNRSTFNIGDVSLLDDDDLIYSQYNILTPTNRPSNRFSKINFAALNKKKNERDSICSRYEDGAIVMVDYESYHLRLFADHVGFELPKSSLHEYLGKLYHDKETLTEEEYELSKKITFNIMYGGVSDDIRNNIPFMAKIADYVETMYKKYLEDGFVHTWYFNRKMRHETYGKLNPYKLFNYLLQNAETERNCLMMKNIHSVIENTDVKLILYHYDAFIFDMKSTDFILTKKIKSKIHEDGKFPVKFYAGINYGNMKLVNV